LVPFANIPNFSSNPNVQFYQPKFAALEPTGNHGGGTLFCVFASIINFASPLNASDSPQLITNLTSTSSDCILQVPTSSPTKIPSGPTAPTSPTKAPTKTSSGFKTVAPFSSAVLAVSVAVMSLFV
jgi:hypothetical protein